MTTLCTVEWGRPIRDFFSHGDLYRELLALYV